jgi:hypothetical protein
MKKVDYTRNILDTIRNIQEGTHSEKTMLTEETEKSQNAIAITDDPKFGQSVLSSQIEQFRTSVDSGAQFSKGGDNVAESPLIFIPSENNLIFSGTIPRLNNLKFQFKLRTNTGEGCFVWCDGLILSEENMKTLWKLYGFYVNWRNQWNCESRDLEMLKSMLDKE